MEIRDGGGELNPVVKRASGELRSAKDRLRIISDATKAFAEATTDYERLATTIVDTLATEIGDACALFVVDDGERLLVPIALRDRFAEAAGRSLPPAETKEIATSSSPLVRVLTSKEPLLVAHADDDDAVASDVDTRFLKARSIHSLVIVPLVRGERAIGVLSFTRSRPSSPAFDQEDLSVAQSLASHAALALGNAKAFADLDAARRDAARARNDAKSARSRLEKLAETGLLGILVAGLDGKILEANETALNMVGYSLDEVTEPDFRWVSLTPPEWTHVDDKAVAAIRASGVAPLREKEYLRKDGTRVPVLIGSAMLDEGDAAISFLLDITERKSAEAEAIRLREQLAAEGDRARLAALVDASDDAIIGKTLDGIVTSWNAGATRLFGWSAAEMIGQSLLCILPDGGYLEEEEILAKLRRGEVCRFETARRKKDGSLVEVSVTSSPVKDGAGNVVGASKVARDITERRRAEREVARAKEAAEAANRELESFSYSVAHDLRAPLRGMNGFAHILLEDHGARLDDEAKELLRDIVDNATRMGKLIDALLSLSRLTRSSLHRVPVDLGDLARSVGSQLAAATPERRVELVVADGMNVYADATLARAVLENLLGNAWKFGAKSTAPRVEVGMRTTAEGRTFFVRDNGAGFDMSFASKLFAPFQRLHTVAEFPGTGIGLASVQRIVHRHGGRIWAEAKPNEGATFFFTLPERGVGDGE